MAAAAVAVAPAVIHASSTVPVVQEVKKEVAKLTALGVPYTTEIAHELSNYYAALWGVNPNVMWAVVKCEDPNLSPTQQSNYHYIYYDSEGNRQTGAREKSFGLAQIHLPAHPSISYEQAIDPDFSLNFLAKMLSMGKGSMWTCWRNL